MSSIDQVAKPSLYLDEAYYDSLIAWRDEASSFGLVTDDDVVASSAALIHHEARLLDSRRFRDWLDLYSQDCIYWVPAEPLADPRFAVTVAFDDRRRLEDRIARIETGFAHSQEPDMRSRHLVTNVEAWETADGNTRRVMAHERAFEARDGRHLHEYVASLDYWLIRESGDWKIKVKRALLINSREGLDAPTFL